MKGGLISNVFSKYPFDTTGFEGECSKLYCGVSKLIRTSTGGYYLDELETTDEFDFNFEDGYNLKITGDIYSGPANPDLDDRFDNIEFKHLDESGDYLTNLFNKL